ncbi:GAP family protein [Streptomyces sp. NPDC058279]|uniref:GAP family protein n=1 Tax=Streptomyces sp. NPDC058279 TaxID=3346418 RepID=UPI0036E521CB
MVFDLFVIGLAINLGPLHNSAFILLLSSERGVRKGLTFVLSWLANLLVVIACVLLLTGGQPPSRHSAPSTAAAGVKCAIGVGLVLYGAYRRRRPPRPPHPPRWSTLLDDASLVTAAGLAWLLQPWGLVAAGAASVVAADLSSVATWLALTGFCLLATLGLIVMELYSVWAPAAAGARLDALRIWIEQHQEQLIVTLSLLAGLWLAVRGIYELVA